MVMSGGAVAAACKEMARPRAKIGAHLLQAGARRCASETGEVVGPSGRIAFAEVARTWYRAPQDLPRDVDPGGLELTAGYKAKRDTGTFSYAATPPSSRSMPRPARWRSSTTWSSRMAARWSIR